MLDSLEFLLYKISVALLYPVVITLLVMVVATIWSLGGFCRQYLDRLKNKSTISDRFKSLYNSQINEALQSDHTDISLTTVIREWERKEINKLDRIRFMVKAGPTLGLAGTLIPMGTSLASLSQGNMMEMSTNMVTAFTTTIVGVICGLIAYLIAMTKEKWLNAAFIDCENHCEILLREKAKDIKTSDAKNIQSKTTKHDETEQ